MEFINTSTIKTLSSFPLPIPIQSNMSDQSSISQQTNVSDCSQLLDGTNLRDLDLSTTVFDRPVTGAQILDIAHSRASPSLFDLPLPDRHKASALNRLRRSSSDVEPLFSPETEYQPLQASQIFKRYMAAIADELEGSPLVVLIIKGSTIRLIFEDEDEFAMLAKGLFIELDVEDAGKIRKSEIRNALVQMEVDMGYFPFSECPQLNDLLRKHGVDDGEGEVEQSQFEELLKFVLQDLEMELSKKNLVFFHKVQIIDGSKIRQLLANEKELNIYIEKALQEKLNAKDGLESKKVIRRFLEKNTEELGLLCDGSNEVELYYENAFADVAKEKGAVELEKEELAKLLKDILAKMADQLDFNPIFQDFD